MRSVPFAIHGMGRIGRALARIAHDRPGLELVAVNDLMPVESIARLLARDTVHGRFHAGVMVSDDGLELGGRRVEVFREGRPERVPWQGTGAEIVVEASGQAATRGLAGRHLRPGTGPEKVLISAIADDADL
ncbi:MAG: glyceraldehyde 3-phosphate dehydrogenase N-terminal domain-containing protein, partial [Holophagales bacterium]|nr:glyceraldehyde 3-phosphate dehydrogenase N-terminal domain-containing protein [Holophagales bacterium]